MRGAGSRTGTGALATAMPLIRHALPPDKEATKLFLEAITVYTTIPRSVMSKVKLFIALHYRKIEF